MLQVVASPESRLAVSSNFYAIAFERKVFVPTPSLCAQFHFSTVHCHGTKMEASRMDDAVDDVMGLRRST